MKKYKIEWTNDFWEIWSTWARYKTKKDMEKALKVLQDKYMHSTFNSRFRATESK